MRSNELKCCDPIRGAGGKPQAHATPANIASTASPRVRLSRNARISEWSSRRPSRSSRMPEVERLVTDLRRLARAEDRLRELAVDQRHRGEDQQPVLDDRVETAVELVGEELVERLRAVGGRSPARRVSCRRGPTTAGQPPASATSPEVSSLRAPSSTCSASSIAIASAVLRDLEDTAVEDALRLDPGRPHVARDQQPHRRALDDRLDECLRGGRGRDVLIVVDHDPGVARPFAKVLREHLGEERRLPLWVLGCREPLEEPATGARDARVGGRDESTSDHGDVDRRAAGPKPADGAALAPQPTARRASSSRIPTPRRAAAPGLWTARGRGSTGGAR